MILARVVLLLGSVLALFGLWRLVGPQLYASVSPNMIQALVFLSIGAVMMWFGRQIEQRHQDGAGDNE